MAVTSQQDLDALRILGLVPTRLRSCTRKLIGPGESRSSRLTAYCEMIGPRIDDMAAWYAKDRDSAEYVLSRIEVIRGFGARSQRLRSALRSRMTEMEQDAEDDDDLAVKMGLLTVAESLAGGRSPSIGNLGVKGIGCRLVDAAQALQLRVPVGYTLTPQGVFAERTGKGSVVGSDRVASRPLFIAGRSIDVTTGGSHMVLVWASPSGRSWIACDISRAIVMDARRVVALSGHDAPVTSENTRSIVRYLADFERVNRRLPTRQVSSRLGWIYRRTDTDQDMSEDAKDSRTQDDVKGFLLPRTFYPKRTQDQGNLVQTVTFEPPPGIGNELAGIHKAGSYTRWLEAAKIATEYPSAMLVLYSVVAALLIGPLRASNFIIDFTDDTSTGKTTLLRYGASAVGSPEEGEGLVFTWDESPVWVESICGALYSLPLIMDDIMRARADDIGSILYTAAQGRGRGRGRPKGGDVRHTATWRLNVISCGEAPAHDFVKKAGARARVLCIQGKPFGGVNETTRDAVDSINDIVTENYGWLIPRVIEFLLARAEAGEWPKLRAAYANARREIIRAGVANSGVASRQTKYVAVLKVAGAIVHALGVPSPTPGCDPIAVAMRAAFTSALTADVAKIAFEETCSWAASNQHQFWGRHSARVVNGRSASSPPSQDGWAGAWEGGKRWSFIAIRTDVLRQLLVRRGYTPQTVLRSWAERKWVTGSKSEGEGIDSVDIDGETALCYRIPRRQYDEATK